MNLKTDDKVLDVRPIFARGSTPCGEIDKAVADLQPNQTFVLLAPFEPVPLYAKLGNLGLGHRAKEMEDGSWRIEFRSDLPVRIAASAGDHPCSASARS